MKRASTETAKAAEAADAEAKNTAEAKRRKTAKDAAAIDTKAAAAETAAAIDTKAAAKDDAKDADAAKDNAEDNAEAKDNAAAKDDAVDVFAALAAGLKAIDAATLDELLGQFMGGAIKNMGEEKFLQLMAQGYKALSKVSKVEFSAEERQRLKFPVYTLVMPEEWKAKKREWEEAGLTVSSSGAQALVFNLLLQIWTSLEDRIAGPPQEEAKQASYDDHELPVDPTWVANANANEHRHFKRCSLREGGEGTPSEILDKLLHEELRMKLKEGVEMEPAFYLAREKRKKKTGEVTGYSATPVFLIPAEDLEEDEEAVAQAARCTVFCAKKLPFTRDQIAHLNILDDDGNVKSEHSKFWRRGDKYYLKNPYGEVKPLGPKFPAQVNSMLADYAGDTLKNGGDLSQWGENGLLDHWDTIFNLVVEILLARAEASMASIAA